MARRAREAAGNVVARADAGGRAAADQVDPIRAPKEFAARQRDRVAGAARLHREVLVLVDERIDEKADVGGAVDVDPAGERVRIRGAVLQDQRVLDKQPSAGRAARHVDAVVDEVMDPAVDDVDLQSREDIDAIQSGSQPLDVEAFEDDRVGRPRADDDAIGAGHQYAGLEALRADRDRLGDGHGAEAAGIEHVDLAGRGGLGDRARKGLARRRAAARVGVVADAGDPGTSRLRVSRHGQ